MTVETTLDPTRTPRPATALRGLCGGAVHLPGDPGYDACPDAVERRRRPAAGRRGRCPGPWTTCATSCAPRPPPACAWPRRAPGTAPARSSREGWTTSWSCAPSGMAAVSVDPVARIARAEGGALWQDVVAAVAPHGLAALHGSSPDVAVAGYSLGGGLGWYARKLGLATNSVTAVELVTADGELVRADAHQHQDLFWALRGGGGSFGLVTAIEFRLYEIADVYAGMLLWDRERAPEVVRAWADWSATAPDEVTTSMRVMSFPPIPELPEFLRGRQVVVIDGAVLADDRDRAVAARAAAGPAARDRHLRPGAVRLPDPAAHGPRGARPRPSPPEPVLAQLPEEAVDAFLAEVGPGSTTSLLSAELRQLGGALGRPHPGGRSAAAARGRLRRASSWPWLRRRSWRPGAGRRRTARGGARALVERAGPAQLHRAAHRHQRRLRCRGLGPAACGARAVDPARLFVANHPVAASSSPSCDRCAAVTRRTAAPSVARRRSSRRTTPRRAASEAATIGRAAARRRRRGRRTRRCPARCRPRCPRGSRAATRR